MLDGQERSEEGNSSFGSKLQPLKIRCVWGQISFDKVEELQVSCKNERAGKKGSLPASLQSLDPGLYILPAEVSCFYPGPSAEVVSLGEPQNTDTEAELAPPLPKLPALPGTVTCGP